MRGRSALLTRRLHPYEVRALAAAGLVVAGAYGGFIAVFGVLLTVDCSTTDSCEGAPWLAPAMAVATGAAILSIHRALPPLWAAARTGQRHAGPFRRLGVAWLAALPWGLLTMYPAFAQVLWTVLAVPVALALLGLGRVAMLLRARRGAPL